MHHDPRHPRCGRGPAPGRPDRAARRPGRVPPRVAPVGCRVRPRRGAQRHPRRVPGDRARGPRRGVLTMPGAVLGRRALLRGALGAAALGGVAGIADLARAAGEDRTNRSGALRVGYLPITDAAPLLIAHGAGLYRAGAVSGQQPVMFRSWSSLAEAFISRQVDVVHLLMPMAVQLRYALGGDARILGWNHTNGSALTVAPDVTELEQLAGTQVAVPFWWSIHNIVLQNMLRARGMRPVVRSAPSKAAGEVGLIVMAPSDMVPALANGAIRAYTVADPFNAAAEVKGVGRIQCFLGDAWCDHACCALLVH